MTQSGPGRPRLEPRRRQGRTPRAEILDAAAELFTTRGYARTSTRGIADAVGIRQASLYHHFAAKDDILDALLDETITGPLELARRLRDDPAPAVVRLYALVRFDVGQLCSARWNLGALYLLPELRSERFAEFRGRRDELREYYEQFAAAVLDGKVAPNARALPFRLVESVINMRSDEGAAPAYAEHLIPEAVLSMLGRSDDPAEIRAAAEDLLRGLGG
ncbi:TetR/AcrR family transcriptional regulator [Nocardia pseudobrasiliensis]|uniref:TetR/AcrR family transcriptional regulator n=1 Tax=Nocardia pseudobrasiliensis TaxID=45979 RepID=UPI000E0C620C|nr:TetR/AcrR family transcriptional regulator [Nocardia pseudobrasiliensis]